MDKKNSVDVKKLKARKSANQLNKFSYAYKKAYDQHEVKEAEDGSFRETFNFEFEGIPIQCCHIVNEGIEFLFKNDKKITFSGFHVKDNQMISCILFHVNNYKFGLYLESKNQEIYDTLVKHNIPQKIANAITKKLFTFRTPIDLKEQVAKDVGIAYQKITEKSQTPSDADINSLKLMCRSILNRNEVKIVNKHVIEKHLQEFQSVNTLVDFNQIYENSNKNPIYFSMFVATAQMLGDNTRVRKFVNKRTDKKTNGGTITTIGEELGEQLDKAVNC